MPFAVSRIKESSLLSLFLLAAFWALPFAANDLQLATRLEFPALSGEIKGNGFDGQLSSLSADGRYVAFTSEAALTGDISSFNQIYLRDRQSGETLLVSHSTGIPRRGANGDSREPLISADGNTVVFLSLATDLVSGPSDDNGAEDVFIWDRLSGETTLVSRAEATGNAGNGASASAKINADGSRVLFDSSATDLASTTDANANSDVFLWDRLADQMVLVTESVLNPGHATLGTAENRGFSEDGEVALVESAVADLIPGLVNQNFGNSDLYHWRASTGTFTLVTRSTAGATTTSSGSLRGSMVSRQLSADGRSVSFLHSGDDLIPGFLSAGGPWNLFQWQETTGDMSLVSRSIENATFGADGSIGNIAVSFDGEYVAFATDATNLSEIDSIPGIDIYRWHRSTNRNELVSLHFQFPSAGNGESRSPRISADGDTVAFESRATDLVAGFEPSGAPDFPNPQVFVWRPSSPTVLASRAFTGATQASATPVGLTEVARDGAAILFANDEVHDLVPNVIGGLFGFEPATGTVSLIGSVFRPAAPIIAFDGRADSVSISDDGRFVAFDTTSLGMVEGFVKNPDALEDSFLWDRLTGEVTLISSSVDGPTLGANDTSQDPTISGDGSLVVFRSSATDLIPGYTPPSGLSFPANQFYAWERESGEITLISHGAPSPSTGANASHSGIPQLSADGSQVVFTSSATDLVAGITDTNGSTDLFLWQASTNSVRLISEGPAGSTANGFTRSPVLSPDGEFLAFRSGASDLVPGVTDTNNRGDIFLWRQSTDEITLITHVAGDPMTAGARGGDDVDLSADGSTVAFYSSGSDVVAGVDGADWFNLYVWDRQSGAKRWVTRSLTTPGISGDGDSQAPQLSSDGSVVIFQSSRTDLSADVLAPGAQDQLFLWESTSDEITLITRSVQNIGLSGIREARDGQISDDGQRVVFWSDDPELVSSTVGLTGRIFVWNRATGQLALASHDLNAPALPNEDSAEKPILSRDGSSIAFISSAKNLVNGVNPGNRQVFVWREDSAAELRASLNAPTLPMPTGEPLSIGVAVENISGQPATHTMAILTLPLGASFLGTSSPNWTCRSAGRIISCRRPGALEPSAITNLEVQALAPTFAGEGCLHATVVWPGTDADMSDNIAEACVEFAPDDWGDAPDPGFPTLAASGGASHGFSDLFLGAAIDVDIDGQPNAAADGDETDGSADEDGVSLPPLVIGQNADLDISASGSGLLDAYFDWNADGDWDDAGEKALDGVNLDAGSNLISLAIPAAATTGPTFVRFRLSTAGTSGPGGRAEDGEVEDYAVRVDTIGLSLGLTASPTLVPEVGGDATFTLRAENTGTQSAELSALVDDLFGSLDGQGTCALPQTIASGASYECAYTLSLSGPVDAMETHTVSATGTSLGFALAAQGAASVTFFDSIAPAVLAYATTGGPLLECDTLQRRPDALTITFSEQLSEGPGGADDPSSYLLLGSGPDLSFETLGCGSVAASDEAANLQVIYVAGPDRFDPSMAELSPEDPLADGLYRLFTCGGLEDLAANTLLDGDQVVDFRVDDGNLFANGHFDCDLRDWRQDPNAAEYAAEDAGDSPESGSMAVAGSGGLSLALDQCLAVDAGAELIFDAAFRLDAAADAAVGLARSCAFFSTDQCTDFVDESFSLALLIDTADSFVDLRLPLRVPDGAAGAMCGFAVESPSGGAWDLFLDAATLRAVAEIFADGFESGDVSKWSSVTP